MGNDQQLYWKWNNKIISHNTFNKSKEETNYVS